jgi:hypothetical protein
MRNCCRSSKPSSQKGRQQPNKRLHLARAPLGALALDCHESGSAIGPVPQSGAVIAAQVKR